MPLGKNPFIINLSGTGQTQYDAWAGGAAFDADANDDGVKNGLAFLLGATNATSAVTLPTVSESSGDLTLTFTVTGTSPLNVTATIPAAGNAAAGKLFGRLKANNP